MGSDSDLPHVADCLKALEEFQIPFETQILSAHRTPDEAANYAKAGRKRGLKIIIAAAGGAAHLPGLMASHTDLPVIGIPVPIGPLQGQDALLSIVQMPKGIPVATVAIGGAYNAGLLAVQMLSIQPEGAAQLNQLKNLNLAKNLAKQKIGLIKKVRASRTRLKKGSG